MGDLDLEEIPDWDRIRIPNHLADLVFRVSSGVRNGVGVLEFVVSDLFPKDSYTALIPVAEALKLDRVLIHMVHWRSATAHLILWRRLLPLEGLHIDLDFGHLSNVDHHVVELVRQLNEAHFEALLNIARDPSVKGHFKQLLANSLASAVSPNKPKQRHAVLALMLQLVFLIFVQRKGWLNGDPQYLKRMYSACHRRGLSIIQCFLKPLFARLEGNRIAEPLGLGNLPRLGGGLFEMSGDLPVIENHWLLQLHEDLCTQFSFSLIETKQGRKVFGVSPEILGHVFENLLCDTQRRSQGVYYTPHEVAIRQAQIGLRKLTANIDRDQLPEFLEGLRILDPSCGSGTYLVAAYQTLLDMWLEIMPASGRTNGKLLALKRKIVTRNLFGVDINATAVRLTEVRLWLNMIQDVEVSDPESAPVLPSLRHHIRVGDFLFQRSQIPAGVLASWPKMGKLKRYQQLFPDSPSHRRNAILKHLYRLEGELQRYLDQREQQEELCRFKECESQGQLTGMETTNLSFEPSTTWCQPFSPHIVFAEAFLEGGFDLILGNPPWLSGSRMDKATKNRFRLGFKPSESRLLPGNADLSLYFVVLALRLMRREAHLGMLLPGKLLQSRYAMPLRAYMAKRMNVDYLLDYGVQQAQLFQADTFPVALGVTHKAPEEGVVSVVRHEVEQTSHSVFERMKLGPGAWSLDPALVPTGCVFGDLGIVIRRGVVTHCKRWFCFDEPQTCLAPNHQMRLLSGRDIQPNSCQPSRWIYWPFHSPDWPQELGHAERQWLRRSGKVKNMRLPYRHRSMKGWILVWKYLAQRPVCVLARDPQWIPDQTTYYIQSHDFAQAYRIFVWLSRPQTLTWLKATAERGKDGCFFYYAHTVHALPIDWDALLELNVPPEKSLFTLDDL